MGYNLPDIRKSELCPCLLTVGFIFRSRDRDMRHKRLGFSDSRAAALALSLIIATYLLLGTLYATATPAWQVPDEPAHFNYVRHVAEQGHLPELCPGDYPYEYLEEIKARRFPPEMSIAPIQYEAHQPPLYYVLAALVYRLTYSTFGWPMPLILRLFSLLLSAISLAVGYKIVRAICPQEPILALGTTAFAATLPMHVAMTAAVNNDVLAELLINLIVWAVVTIKASDWTLCRAGGLGILLGFAFLTKMQSYAAFGVAFSALFWDILHNRDDSSLDWTQALGRAAIMSGAAFTVALPWLIRNAMIYGFSDPLVIARHDQVVLGQLTTQQLLDKVGIASLLRQFVWTSFRSFWGQFGWMGVLLDERIYLALALFSGLVLAGFGLHALHLSRRIQHVPASIRRGWALLTVWAFVTTWGYLWWNTKYVQHQGRYLFPALVPWGLAFTLGLCELFAVRWLKAGKGQRSPRPWLIPLVSVIALLAILGMATGDIKGFGIALLASALALTLGGHWLERIQPGAAMALTYAGMAVFSIVCLYGYIVPALAR